MHDPEDIGEDWAEAEVTQDLERYFRLIVATQETWYDFWLLGVLTIVGGTGVYFFSGEIWAVTVCALVLVLLFVRTARIIGRFDGELSFLHRKWIRRGLFFVTDGKSADALPHRID